MAPTECIEPTADDIKMMLLANTHFSAKKKEPHMETYVYGKATDSTDPVNFGCCLMDLQKTWDKLVLAARVLAAVDDPATIFCVGQRQYAQRAIIKFAKEIGATASPGRFTPGQFTNQKTTQFVEPRILLVADPRTDSQAIKEASYVNIPTVAFCGSDSPLEYVDICVPGNNRGKESLGLLYWLLAREIKRIKVEIPRDHAWDVAVDLFMHRDPDEVDRDIADADVQQQDDDDFHDDYNFDDAQADFGFEDPNAAATGQGQPQQVQGADGQFQQNWDAGAGGVAPTAAADAQGGQGDWNAAQGQQVGDWNAANDFGDNQFGNQQQQQQQQQNNWGQQPPQQQNQQQQYQPPQTGYQPQSFSTGAAQGGLDDWDED